MDGFVISLFIHLLILFPNSINAVILLKQGTLHPSIQRFQYISEPVITSQSSMIRRSQGFSYIYKTIQIELNGTIFTLDLQENKELDVMGSTADHARYYKGQVRDYRQSFARLTFYSNGLMEGSLGYLITDGYYKKYHLEIMGEHSVGFNTSAMFTHDHLDNPHGINWKVVAYDEADVIDDNDVVPSATCAKTNEQKILNKMLKRKDGNEQFGSNLHKRSQYVEPTDPDCLVALIGDIHLYQQYGSASQSYMLSLMNDVQEWYLNQMNIGMPVIYTYVISNPNDPSGLNGSSTDSDAWLETFGLAVFNRLFPNYDTIAPKLCINHLLTTQFFGSILGVAYTGSIAWDGAEYVPIGACEDPYNVGLTTNKLGQTSNNAYQMTRKTKTEAMFHEMGHNLGSIHDNDYVTGQNTPIDTSLCNIPGYRYIMYYSLATSPYSELMSPCSIYAIKDVWLPQMQCLVPRGSYSAQTIATSPFQDQIYNKVDQCTQISYGLVSCPFTDTTLCHIVCALANQDAPQCTDYSQVYGNLKDGTVCDFDEPVLKVCISGQCIPDPRTNVCDRSKACCDAYGALMPSSHACGNYNQTVSNACVSPTLYCDPSSNNPDECPSISYRPVGSPCGYCTDNTDISTCNNTMICTVDGQCVINNVTSSKSQSFTNVYVLSVNEQSVSSTLDDSTTTTGAPSYTKEDFAEGSSNSGKVKLNWKMVGFFTFLYLIL